MRAALSRRENGQEGLRAVRQRRGIGQRVLFDYPRLVCLAATEALLPQYSGAPGFSYRDRGSRPFDRRAIQHGNFDSPPAFRVPDEIGRDYRQVGTRLPAIDAPTDPERQKRHHEGADAGKRSDFQSPRHQADRTSFRRHASRKARLMMPPSWALDPSDTDPPRTA